ncbi:glycosyltransferase family 4 protein [Longirhabdus pacifica]|uniref:glycosyltransferase family 4 protein n=1 Tax=Longirhabdus pacifica TaxID=2305227 RepID=UPI001008E59E|nr:glycosyltransferase family 4 protein [Longirhabdus pacifica]
MKDRKMLLVTGVFLPGIGGMQNYYSHLCKNSGQNVTVLAPHYEGDEQFDAKQPYRIIRGDFFRDEKVNVTSWIKLFRKTNRVIKQEKIEVTMYGYILIGLIGWIFNVLFGRKYMVSTHGKDVLEFKHIPVLSMIAKMILKRAHRVVANSQYTKRIVMSYGVSPHKIDIVNPGVASIPGKKEKNQDLIEKYKLENKFVLLSVSRLVRRKGHDKVIEALPGIVRAVPNAVYVIVGDGPERERLEQLAITHNVGEHIVFVGKLGDEKEVEHFYHLCDVFIMVSRQLKVKGDVEGFGIVYLEAASCVKPVIAGDSGGVSEAVLHQKTGLLVDPLHRDGIVDAVTTMHADPALRDRIAQQAYERVTRQFTYSILAKQFDQVIEKACDVEGYYKGIIGRRTSKQSKPRLPI